VARLASDGVAPRPLGRRFWQLFTANGLSALGDGLVLVAIPLLAVTKTSNPLLIAGVVVAGRLPALLVAIPAGALADRLDRRRLVVAINLAQAAVLGLFSLLVISGHDDLAVLYATTFLLGAGAIAFDLTSQACLPQMVPPPQFSRANGYLLAADYSGEQFAGPALGGVLFATARAVPFVGDAVSFVASALLARSALAPSPGGPAEPRQAQKPWRGEIRAGLRWFRTHRLLRLLALVVAMLAFCQAMVLSELVLYGTRELHLTKTAYGLAFAGMSAGNIAGSLVANRAHARFGDLRSISAAALIAGAAYLALADTTTVGLAVAVMFFEAVAVAIGNVTTLTIRQQVIPSDMLGRVGSVFRMIIVGFIPLGALLGGAVAAAVSVRWAFATAGMLQLLVFAASFPVLRRRLADLRSDGVAEGASWGDAGTP
jgi:MFS family permease